MQSLKSQRIINYFYEEHYEAKMQEFREEIINLAEGYERWTGKFQRKNKRENKTITEMKISLKGTKMG